MKRVFWLAVVFLLGVAATAWATPAGENYWLSIGPLATVGGQFLSAEDDLARQTDAYLGGGFGLGHHGDFSFMLQGEGGGMPLANAGQLRAEARMGFRFLTLGPTIAVTIGRYSVVSLGPAVGFDWPLYTGATPREGSAHLLGVFYRLDVPVGENADDLQPRHQAGVRFLFDVPLFLELFAKPGKSWWGGSWQPHP